MENKKNIVLVPGLFMPSWHMNYIKKHLNTNVNAHCFGYASRKLSIADIADKLNDYIVEKDIEVSHFIGHSMGGLVIAEYLKKYRQDKTVTIALGSPLAGASAARNLSKFAIGRMMLGQQKTGLLHHGISTWPEPHQLATIVGTNPFCLGRLLAIKTPKQSDGMVAISETNVARIHDTILLPTTHALMVISKQVIKQINQYLTHDCFSKK